MMNDFYNILFALVGIRDPLYASTGYGGVFMSLCRFVYIENAIFMNNSQHFAGVGYLMPHPTIDESVVWIKNCSFIQNIGGENSGSLSFSPYYQKLLSTIINNTFWGNEAKSKWNNFFTYMNYFLSGWMHLRIYRNK